MNFKQSHYSIFLCDELGRMDCLAVSWIRQKFMERNLQSKKGKLWPFEGGRRITMPSKWYWTKWKYFPTISKNVPLFCSSKNMFVHHANPGVAGRFPRSTNHSDETLKACYLSTCLFFGFFMFMLGLSKRMKEMCTSINELL